MQGSLSACPCETGGVKLADLVTMYKAQAPGNVAVKLTIRRTSQLGLDVNWLSVLWLSSSITVLASYNCALTK